MSLCARCEGFPEVPDTGTLFLAPPLSHGTVRLRHLIERAGLTWWEPTAGMTALAIEGGVLDRFAMVVGQELSDPFLEDTWALILTHQGVPSLFDLVKTQSLARLLGQIQSRWLVDLLAENRLTAFFQPIVQSGGSGKLFAFEMLARGISPEGGLVSPGHMFGAARSASLLFQLDRATRLAAIHRAGSLGVETPLFINFDPASIYDPAYCLRTTAAAVAAQGFKPHQVVFEVTETAALRDLEHLKSILRYYRENGYRFALDDFGAGHSSLNMLEQIRPDFIKLDMGLIRGVDQDPFKAQIASKILEMATSLCIASVAEGVETEGELRWAAEHGATLTQGYFVGRPAPTPVMPLSLGA